MCQTNRKRGYTLVEILIASAVLMVVGILVVRVYLFGQRTYETGSDIAYLQEASRKALLSMLNELQESREVIEPVDGGPKTIDYAVVRNSENEEIKYYLEGTVLMRDNLSKPSSSTHPKNPKEVTDNVEKLKITRFDYKLLSVRVVVVTPGNESEPDKKRRSQIMTCFYLRNAI